MKAPPDAGAPSLDEPSPSTLFSFFASSETASEFESRSVLEWGISPFGGELEPGEGGFKCIDDSEDFDVESDEAIIAS